MDILILNWKDIKNPEKGGAEIIAFEFAKRLVKDGHTVSFFSREFKGEPKIEKTDGVKIIRGGSKFTTYIHAYFYYKSLKKKPDKVVDMVNTICWQTPLYVPSKNRIAYVNQLAKEVFFFELPWPVSRIAYYLERLQYISYVNTKFLCYSKSTKNDLISFGVKSKNIYTFPLGLDHIRYTRKGGKAKDPLFVFVARFVRMKRADLCIKAMSIVIKKYPQAKLALVGDGPDKHRLLEIIKRYNISSNVSIVDKNNFFLEKTKGDVKVNFMREAWALLLPSVKEGWGMVVTEAASCGTPSIVSDVTGLRDSVRKDKTGIIVSCNPTDKELASAMIKIIENKQFRVQLSKNAIAWSGKFDWDTSYKQFKKALLS